MNRPGNQEYCFFFYPFVCKLLCKKLIRYQSSQRCDCVQLTLQHEKINGLIAVSIRGVSVTLCHSCCNIFEIIIHV